MSALFAALQFHGSIGLSSVDAHIEVVLAEGGTADSFCLVKSCKAVKALRESTNYDAISSI